MRSSILHLSVFLFPAAVAIAAPPQPEDSRLTIDLVAQAPEIRTPTAIDVDSKGRIWVLENNTHFRPKNYDAPPTDRVLIMDDFDTTGHARRISVFADGFRDGMGLKLLPDGGVIVSTRAETFLYRDAQAAGKVDQRTSLLKLDTKDDYPHNGLSGIALDGHGKLYAGLGENHGTPWTLTGSDGVAIKGADEGGIFRCNLDGTKLERWALGLWNPFGLTFDAAGRLFALDNDPGAGSFCRLLYIVHAGDFGYRYRYGRTIDHPFLSWFGEIPGTLPPVCLVGEAPTGLLQYTGSNLPSEIRGDLLGCTWNDHGIQRFHLDPRGASFSCNPQWLVRGGDDFRPSGIAQAPDGSLVMSDWVDHSYEVHGKGRVWRVRAKQPQTSAAPLPRIVRNADESAMDTLPADGSGWDRLKTSDPYLFHAAIEALRREPTEALRQRAIDPDAHVRLGALLALRRQHAGLDLLPKWLEDPDGAVRRAALQWICEEHLAEFQPKLETVLSAPLSRGTFLSYLATIQMLVAGKPDSNATISQTRQIALDDGRPPGLRALATRLLPTEAKAISNEQLKQLIGDKDAAIQLAAIRILATRKDDASQTELRRIAASETGQPYSDPVRAEAVAGLAYSAAAPETQAVLNKVLNGTPLIRNEALRAIRGHLSVEEFQQLLKKAGGEGADEKELCEQLAFQTRSAPALQPFASDPLLAKASSSHPLPTEPWPAVMEQEGNAAAGRRLFYHPNGPHCYTCHTIEGRGGNVGPDLTQIKFSKAQLLEAIREPSKEIAPAFTQWLLKLKDGREVNGIDAFEDSKDTVTLIDATGARTVYRVPEIVSREPLPISLMPPGLDALVTAQEMRDLLAYLAESRE